MTGKVDLEPDTPVHLTPRQLAHRWQVSVRTLERWRAAGRGPAWFRAGDRIRYRAEAVRAQEQWNAASDGG